MFAHSMSKSESPTHRARSSDASGAAGTSSRERHRPLDAGPVVIGSDRGVAASIRSSSCRLRFHAASRWNAATPHLRSSTLRTMSSRPDGHVGCCACAWRAICAAPRGELRSRVSVTSFVARRLDRTVDPHPRLDPTPESLGDHVEPPGCAGRSRVGPPSRLKMRSESTWWCVRDVGDRLLEPLLRLPAGLRFRGFQGHAHREEARWITVSCRSRAVRSRSDTTRSCSTSRRVARCANDEAASSEACNCRTRVTAAVRGRTPMNTPRTPKVSPAVCRATDSPEPSPASGNSRGTRRSALRSSTASACVEACDDRHDGVFRRTASETAEVPSPSA